MNLTRCAQLWIAGIVTVALGAAQARALDIVPTYTDSNSSRVLSAGAQNVINDVIQLYEHTFTDPITVDIKFRTQTTGLGGSSWFFSSISYQTFYNALHGDRTSADDDTAVGTLPNGAINPVNNGTLLSVKRANLLAVGLPSGTNNFGAPFDNYVGHGVVSLNMGSINILRSPDASYDSNKYDLRAVVSHEIDEVLGLGSGLNGIPNPLPFDLYRYDLAGSRTYTTSGDNAYFSFDGGTTDVVRLNQNSGGDYGDWWSTGTHTPRVQDAFGTPGAEPNLSYVEWAAMDVIGYDLVPEPATLILFAVMLVPLLLGRRARHEA